jgi:PIN domain nuclease of toxin-antitoxin system
LSLLVDTNIVIWWLERSARLPAAIAGRIDAGDEVIIISPVVSWEIEIKRAIGKLDAPADLEEQVAASHFIALPITLRHATVAGRLPLHHRDPFDRLLIAQAQVEGLTLVTADGRFKAYEIQVLMA